MLALVSITIYVILQNVVCADDTSEIVVWHRSFTIGIVIGTVLCTLIGTCLAYIILRTVKRKLSPPAYTMDDVPRDKSGMECFYANSISIPTDVSNVYQVQPILTVSEVVSSFKQSFNNLGDAILPRRSTHDKKILSVQEKNEIIL
ncbi:unnamed protein product [Adineta ricciae]|uniref:Uncharacterized protein n=1 Tax=Adineta ricciae TaxID=249248 RepID=A0A813W1M3_ADIRI|nr:unnamed protein product [Adineta ricciae]CAF1011925.1 unnamed protein product [Adineta ricciae]